jgi:hypothetical protein
MPAVGIVLFLIGLWIVIRTLRGGLASTLTREGASGPSTPQPATSAPASGPSQTLASEWRSVQGLAAIQRRQRRRLNPAFGPAPGIPDPLIQTGL